MPPITDLLRSRGGQSRSSISSNHDGSSKTTPQQHLLPLHSNNGTTTSTSRGAASNISSNSFLLGGMYVPNKDKRKRRRMVHNNLRYGNNNPMFSICIQTCQNAYVRYPFIIICVGIFFIVVMIITHQNDTISRRSSSGSNDRSSNHQKHWTNYNKNNNIDWLLQDQTILHRLPSLQAEQKRIEKSVHDRREYQQHTNRIQQRLKLLEKLVPEWYHRNDPIVIETKKEANENIVVDSSHQTNSDVKRNNIVNVDHTAQHGGDQSVIDDLTHVRPKTSNRIRRSLQNNIHNYTTATAAGKSFAPSSCPVNLTPTNISISLLIQSSVDRVWILHETCQRWTSPMIAVVAVHDPIDTETNTILQNHVVQFKIKCQQLTIIIYHLDTTTESTPETYPVNALRNVALDAVTTSHILMIDIDFIPSQDLDKMIQSTLQTEQQKQQLGTDAGKSTDGAMNKVAMVIPALDRVLHPPCTSNVECSQHLLDDPQFIPLNFNELLTCYSNDNCIIFQSMDNWEGHSSTRTELWLQQKWYTSNKNESENALRTIPCFDSLRYEPYVVIRWCPPIALSSSTDTTNTSSATTKNGIIPVAPYYDERFHGYGKNKIQLISHLRLMGYQFTILPMGGFIVHNPHVESSSKQTWNNVQHHVLHRTMDQLYQTFLNELVSIYLAPGMITNGATPPKDIVNACTRTN